MRGEGYSRNASCALIWIPTCLDTQMYFYVTMETCHVNRSHMETFEIRNNI